MTRQLELRKRISDAVHSAVCEFTGSAGIGRCLWYAAAGYTRSPVALACWQEEEEE